MTFSAQDHAAMAEALRLADTIIKSLSDLKTLKTMAIVEMLDHVRLLGAGEVGKGWKYEN